MILRDSLVCMGDSGCVLGLAQALSRKKMILDNAFCHLYNPTEAKLKVREVLLFFP